MSHLQAGEPIAPTSGSPPARKTRRCIDWRLGARLSDARGRTARVQAAEEMLARMERGAHPG